MNNQYSTLETIYQSAMGFFCTANKSKELTEVFTKKLSKTKHVDFAQYIEQFLSERMNKLNQFIEKYPDLELTYYFSDDGIDVLLKQKAGCSLKLLNHPHFFADIYHKTKQGVKVACIDSNTLDCLLNNERLKDKHYIEFKNHQGNGWEVIQVAFSMMNDEDLCNKISKFNSAQKVLEFEQAAIEEVILSGLPFSLPHTQFIKDVMIAIYQHWNCIVNNQKPKDLSFDEVIAAIHSFNKKQINKSNRVDLFAMNDFVKLYAQWEFVEQMISYIINLPESNRDDKLSISGIFVTETGNLNLFIDDEFVKKHELYGEHSYIKDGNFGLDFNVSLLEPIQLTLNISKPTNIDNFGLIALNHQCKHEVIDCSWSSMDVHNWGSSLPSELVSQNSKRRSLYQPLETLLSQNYLTMSAIQNSGLAKPEAKNSNSLLIKNIKLFASFVNDSIESEIVEKNKGIVVEAMKGIRLEAKLKDKSSDIKYARRIIDIDNLFPFEKDINGWQNKKLIWDDTSICKIEFCLINSVEFEKALKNVEIDLHANCIAQWDLSPYIYDSKFRHEINHQIHHQKWNEFREAVELEFASLFCNHESDTYFSVIVEYQFHPRNSTNNHKWIIYANAKEWGMETNDIVINNPYLNLSSMLR